jgi:hypothetical protein
MYMCRCKSPHVQMHVWMCMCIPEQVYRCGEREREREMRKHSSSHVDELVCNMGVVYIVACMCKSLSELM